MDSVCKELGEKRETEEDRRGEEKEKKEEERFIKRRKAQSLPSQH